jgi:hypothetical protein
MNLPDISIIPNIITGVFSIVVALISVWWKDYLDRRKKERAYAEAISENDMINMIAVQDWLNNIRKELDVDRAAIYQFHNGGHFASGASIKRYSMTYESCRPGIASIKKFSQNILASDRPNWISILFQNDYYVCDNPTKIEDEKTREELEQFGVKASAAVPVRDIGGYLVGFITIQSVAQPIDFNAIKQLLLDYSTEISGYLVKKK